MEDDLLTATEAAAVAGITAGTWRRYVTDSPGRKRQGPAPDDHRAERGHLRPLWRRSTVEAWLRSRPGMGKGDRPSRHKASQQA
jgi:hypothetical protein